MDTSRCERVLLVLLFVGCHSEGGLDESTDTFIAELSKLEKLTNLYPRKDRSEKVVTEPAKRVRKDEVIELSDLGLVLRKITFDKPIDGNGFIFFSATEISNRMYAAYLSDTDQMRDDSELEKAEAEGAGMSSTASPVIHVGEPTALWRNGKIPANREDHPVSFVTTGQGMNFCKWLNGRYDLAGVFRLPTTAEWLFAAYGLDREFPWGNDEKEWAGSSTEPVKARPELRTPDGLYGMWGNVSEFVLSPSDGYGGQIKDKYSPFISMWLGTGFKDHLVRGELTRPRQDYWGYTHSLNSRSGEWGFRIVFVPKIRIP